ncbi:MAG: sulfatase [Deltaproteobacteria bacterium]|nr:sulfatase [Deltaproteobacteria bacterium]
MTSDSSDSVVGQLIAGLLGGAVGGALIGLGEVALIVFTSAPPEEYWLVPYAVIAYGSLGLVLAAGGALVRLVAVRAGSAAAGFSAGVAIAVALLLMVVGRYHVIQRVFHEELVTASPAGLGVHAGIVTGGVVIAWLIARLCRLLYSGGRMGGAFATLALLLAGSVGLALATAPTAPAAAAGRKSTASGPNVIFIVLDTLRADALSCYGGKAGQTPALDAFARDGVLFEHAYAQSSWTRPSIASMLTGVYPSVHGAVHKMDMLPERALTLAEVFAAAGYWTAGIVTNINVAPIFNFQQGFGEYHYLEPEFYFWATDSATRLAIYKGLRTARERLGASRMYFYNYYQDAEVVGQAVGKWLEQRPPQPFFLLIHYMDPHDPFFAIPYNGYGIARANTPSPPASRRAEVHDLYLQDVSYLDTHLGRLFDQLRQLKLYDDSVIAIVADHGEEFLEHGGWWHGTTLYEEGVRVPLLIKRAREANSGTRRSEIARTIDVASTMVAAAGMAVPERFMGRDLFGSVAGEPLYAEEDLEGNVLASIRVGNWKLITANPGNPRGLAPVEMYDLGADPAEQTNRAASEPARAASLLEELGRMRARIAEGRALRQRQG